MSHEIPKGWQDVELGDVLSELRNGFSCSQAPGEGNTRVTRIETIADGSIDPNRVGLTKWDKRLENYRLQTGDILFSHINSHKHIGKTALYEGGDELYHGMNLMLLRPLKNRAVPSFLIERLRLEEARDYFRSSCRPAVNQASLSKGIIASYRFLLPPLHEQRLIAEVLSSVDDAIQVARKIIDQTSRVKQGILHELMTKGISHEQFRETEIGKIPKAWDVLPLKALGQVITGKTPSTKSPDFWGGQIPFLTPSDINEERVCSRTERFVSPMGAQQGKLVPQGSIAVTCIASIGKIAIIGQDCITNQQINTFIPHDASDNIFFYFALLSRMEELRSLAGTTAVPIINKSTFSDFTLPVPSPEERAQIANILCSIDDDVAHEKAEIQSLQTLKSALASDLLTGRRRVSADLLVAAE